MAIGISAPHPATFSIGRVLRDSFAILARNFISFAVIAIGFRLLWLLVSFVEEALGQNHWEILLIQALAGQVITALTQAAIIFGTLNNLNGHKATWDDIRRGLSFAPVVIMAGLLVSSPNILSTIVSSVFADHQLLVGATQALLGFVTVFLFVIWWVYAPAIVADGNGILAALSRSAQLTKGRRWRILGLLMLFAIIVFASVYAVAMIAGASIAEAVSTHPSTPSGLVGLVIIGLISALFAVLGTVSYYYLRAEKEGADSGELARVFD